MTNPELPLKSPRIRPWRYLPILIILGLAAYLLLPQIATLQHSWSVVQSMTLWAVALAAVSQVLSYLGGGFMLHAILDNEQQKLSMWKGALITMAAFSVGLVAGGWVGSAAATYGWIHRENHDGNTAALAGTLPALLNNAVLVGVSLIGILYLLVVHDLSKLQLIEFGVVLLVLGLTAAGGVVALRFPETATRLAVWLSGRWAALRHKPFEPENTIASVRQFVVAWESLRNGKWVRPMLGAIANIGFDMLTLYFLFVAAGHDVSLGILFAGYGLPLILGKMAFLLPGGVGVIEGSMVALYDSLQVPNAVSVVVILGYRLFSFWLPTLLGFAAAAYLSGRLVFTKGKQA
ncbi:MAG TPA: YbhN family protein [Anaerolineales bacterium]